MFEYKEQAQILYLTTQHKKHFILQQYNHIVITHLLFEKICTCAWLSLLQPNFLVLPSTQNFGSGAPLSIIFFGQMMKFWVLLQSSGLTKVISMIRVLRGQVVPFLFVSPNYH